MVSASQAETPSEAFTPGSSLSAAVQQVQLQPKMGPVDTPVRITLRLSPGNEIAAFRVLFGGIEADSQLANEERLPDYERIVLVAPAPQQTDASVYVAVQGMSRAGQVMQTFQAGLFAYNQAPRPPKRVHQEIEESPAAVYSPASDLQARAGPSCLQTRALLRLTADLDTMARGWSEQEWLCKRRLVQFWRQQDGNVINASFRPIRPSEYVPDTMVISCIYREDTDECFATSVDLIYLLEALIGMRFAVEEKNRVRRNLEGYKPSTVFKNKRETEAFFRLIMNFSQPRPRNIEKDVKVFPWRVVSAALKKIVGKYTVQDTNASFGATGQDPGPFADLRALPPISQAVLPDPLPGYPALPAAVKAALDHTTHPSFH